jgi:hypothetical protein
MFRNRRFPDGGFFADRDDAMLRFQPAEPSYGVLLCKCLQHSQRAGPKIFLATGRRFIG